jgi:hypothetical protein
MLDLLFGPRSRLCDGISRRSCLKLGALALGGLSQADLLRRQAQAAVPPTRHKAVIQVVLRGGASHYETFDPKPDAPVEYRSMFPAIATKLPGVQVSELFPGLARQLDKFTILRSVRTSSDGGHASGMHTIMTGFEAVNLPESTNPGNQQRPSLGSVVARVRGPLHGGLPTYVMAPQQQYFGYAAWLGVPCNPFVIKAPILPNGLPENPFDVRNLTLPRGVDVQRMEARQGLLETFDDLRRDLDASGQMAGMDTFVRSALEMTTGARIRDAFDLKQEKPQLRERYGRHTTGRCALLARRLIERGVRFVTIEDLYYGNGWDDHNNLVSRIKKKAPLLDMSLSALVEDLSERGLLDDVLIMVFGEMGRTPKINIYGGRDHWTQVSSGLLAGGGLPHGQVIGSSDSKGAYPKDRPLTPGDVMATMFRFLEFDPETQLPGPSGRPMPLLPPGCAPIQELL